MTMDKIDYSIEENQIEKEDEGNVTITMPFNPNMIKIRRDPFTISELVDKMEHGEIRFDTPFQRKSDLWDEEKQSRLIESLLLKLPLPAFYFSEGMSTTQISRDGLMRVMTPQSFKLKLLRKLFFNEDVLNSPYPSTFALYMSKGFPVYCSFGSERNIKITYPEDIDYLKKLFEI